MAIKRELLLIKKADIEAAVQAIEARRYNAATFMEKQAAAGDMFQQMMDQWAALTAMQIVGDVAVIPLRGTITPDDPFAPLYGETSLALFNANFNKALSDSKIKGIVLNVYSPGGYVYGVEAAANAVFAARGTKPIVAYTDSLAASAAYWLASSADKVVLGSETAEVGSIGVYMVHFDYSAMLDQAGIKVTEVTSGEFKGIGSPYSPLTKEEEKILQADANYVYTRFVNTVARNRGMSVKDVLKSANGLTFYGTDAISLGLADSINTLQEVIAMTTKTEGQGTATTETPVQQTEAEKQAAAAHQAALKAEQEKSAKLEAELAAYRAKEAEAAKEKLTAECNTAYKAAFGRDATAEEQEVYAKADESGRKVIQANLKESSAARDKIIAAAGLTKETATEGKTEASDPNTSPLVQAARRLGLAQAQ